MGQEVGLPIMQNKTKSDIHSSVVIIGGGPVGLWTAIRIKTLNPYVDITIFERYQTYVRANMIKVCKSFEVGVQKESPLIKIFQKKIVSILEIEGILLEEAKKLNIKIVHEMVEDIDSLKQRFPDNHIWIAADGAHSKFRDHWYGEKEDHVLFNVVQVTYTSKEIAKKLQKIKLYALKKQLNRFVEETVRENKVTLRFFVDDKMFNEVSEFTAKNPCKNLDQISKELKQLIEFWIKARKLYEHEQWERDSFSMTTFRLNSYTSKKFSHKSGEHHHAIVGDAAFGVPFYRSMRNGWVASNILVENLFDYNFEKKYEDAMKRVYFNEKLLAQNKAGLVNFSTKINKLLAKSPIQLIHIDENQINATKLA